MSTVLKPCPFCGNAEPLLQEHPPHAHFIADMPDHHGSWTLECVACNVGMIEDEPGAKDRLIERWNRRTALAADTVEVPREPTYEMVQAGAKVVKDNLPYHTGTKAIYLAMIAAAASEPEAGA